MRYPQFRAHGLFIGSGVVEAGCQTVIGARLKRSGMFWTVRAASAIITLRCCKLSRKFEEYWGRTLSRRLISNSYVAHPLWETGNVSDQIDFMLNRFLASQSIARK